MLLSSPVADGLRALDLRRATFDRARLLDLVQGENLGRLEVLRIATADLEVDDLFELARSRLASKVRLEWV